MSGITTTEFTRRINAVARQFPGGRKIRRIGHELALEDCQVRWCLEGEIPEHWSAETRQTAIETFERLVR